MFYKIKMDYQYIFLMCCVVYLSQVSCQIQHRQQHAQPKQAAESRKYSKCEPPTTAPQKLEKIIGQCQDEIKQALLQEALEVIDDVKHQIGNKQNHKQHQNSNNDNKAAAFVPHTRTKRENFSGEERRVAGCLLQCVYRKVKAVDANNFPSAEGLVRLYSEGVQDRNYFTATYQSVQFCMKLAEQVRQSKPNGVLDGGQTCDLAYDMFNCVSDQIEKFCEVPA